MTSIYSTGTVSVTNGNAVVTGSVTAWAVAGVGGGMFSSAGVAVPILSVEGDTSLTLAYPWPGDDAAGSLYAIQRDYSDAASIVDLYDRFSRVLVTLSLIGIHPNDSGTIAKRDALSLTVDDEGFFFAHVEIGYDITIYRWTGTAWEGPFDTKGEDGLPGVGAGGYGLPTGGTTGQFLRKASGTDGDSAWAVPAASAISNDSSVWGATTKDALDSLSSSLATTAAGLAKRGTVRVATTANVTIAIALNSGDAIDGVTLATGDLVLVKSQTAPAENGIYVVAVTPVRSTEFDTYNEHPGALIVVQEGTSLADTFWYCTSNVGGTLGTTSIAFSQMTLTGTYTAPGTGAVSRTIASKLGESVSVKDFGATGDGVTDDTAAIQAAETYRASVGGQLIFPPGIYQISATSISVNRANGGAWRGVGQAMLRASANNTFLCVLSGATIGSNAKAFRITGLHFHGGGFTGVRGVHETSPYFTIIDNCTFTQLAFCASFIGNATLATQTGWIQIHDIKQYGAGSWAFYAFDNTTYLFHVEMNNIHQIGTGASTWENPFWVEGRRCVGLSINNMWSGSLDGAAVGLLMRGDCQGVFVTNATFVWATIGIQALTWTDTLKPSYVYMSNIGVDQHTVSGAEIEGRTWYITNANFANGYVRTNSGQACLLKSTCTDISMLNCLFAYDQKSGLVVQNGATKIRIGDFTAENNNQVAGSNYDVDLGASPFVDVRLHGANVIGSAGVNATGQRVVNGATSKEVSRNTGSAASTAVTTQEDLMTYTIPANVLKPGQTVRLTAWGVTAANGNTKTARLWFGGNSVIDHSGAWNNVPWRLQADIYITGSNTQEYSTLGWPSANTQSVRQGTLTVTDTSAIIVKATGQNGTASAGDITCQGFRVEILD
jgi:polygalacturonase